MAAPSRPQAQRNGRFLLRRIVDLIRATLGRGHTTLRRRRPGNHRRGQTLSQADGAGTYTRGRLRDLRERSVAGIRHLARHGGTTARTGEPIDPAPTARNRRKAAALTAGRAANRGPAAAERAAPAAGRQVELAKPRGRTHRTSQHQGRPRQAKRRQDLEQQTVQQLRKRAREADVKGRSSMTKDQLIKALRDHR
jgi:Rho termination factor, N-terminal domain